MIWSIVNGKRTEQPQGMEKYLNKNGDSGVTHYEIGEDFIEVRFKGKSTVYIYTHALNGKSHIDHMKKLALKGLGLSSYIAEHPSVKDHYKKR